ncbi:MAG: hydantoinase [Phascolarctobacterium sp.]|nr:MAG: hydantoinase [Phascolarctobacterium sp.]
MLLGIDVGGTFTDAVLINDGAVYAQAKKPTTHGEVLRGILDALDAVLAGADVKTVERVVISSTIVTNALTEGKTQPVFLAVMTGPGMNVKGCFPVEPYLVSGYVDHRGKITARIDFHKHFGLLDKPAGTQVAAVSGKFSVRNPENEYVLAHELKKSGYKKVFLGSELSGELNFIRRTNSAYFAAAVDKTFAAFGKQVEWALKERNITAPVQILKADGGTLPLEAALKQPVEAVFTGPAASVLGIKALGAPQGKSISLDVGGTTTDIAFWDNGEPLLAKKGAMIGKYPTAVRSFHMRSVGIGGDSAVKKLDAGFAVGPERAGRAAALGGSAPTLADALIVLGLVAFGDKTAAQNAVAALCHDGETPEQAAQGILDAALDVIESAIKEMMHEWSIQPVYTVSDVLTGSDFTPQQLVGVGGGAPGLIHALGKRMNLPVVIPPGGMVANAIGAALARPTVAASLRADTTEGYYLIPESGKRERLPKRFNMQAAEEILSTWLHEKAGGWQMEGNETEVISREYFRTVHGYYDTGEIIYLRMQLKPGILYKITGREVAF